MVITHNIEGYENFCQLMKTFDKNDQVVHIYFSGSKLPSGESWCDDCVRAAPVIEAAIKQASPQSHFIYCRVGDRSSWKHPDCPFRKDPKTRLMVLPTVLRWECPQRLEGDQCEKQELLEMLFIDE